MSRGTWTPPPSEGSGPETDPIASAAVAAEAARAQAAEAAKANTSALTSETTRATAAEQAASTAAANEAARAQSAESSEATRAQAAEAANTTSITTHVNSTTAHSSDHITFDDSGLIVVKGANVKVALAAIDTWVNARPTSESGLLSALPANGARPNGSTYFATDQYGGTTYRMVSGSWVQQSAGVLQASGQIIAGPAQLSGAGFDVKAVGTTPTDVTGMSISVPASSRPVLLKASLEAQMNTGTAANASIVRLVVAITDSSNVVVASCTISAVQVGSAALVLGNQAQPEAYLAAPVTAGTYKVRAWLVAAAPANWTSVFLLPGNANGSPSDNFYALAA